MRDTTSAAAANSWSVLTVFVQNWPLGPQRQPGQAGGLGLAEHQVGILQRLRRRALAEVVDGAERDHEAGARIHGVGKEREVRSGRPARVRAVAFSSGSSVGDGAARSLGSAASGA